MISITHLDKNMKDNLTQSVEALEWIAMEDTRIRVSGFTEFQTEHCLNRIPKNKISILKAVNPCLTELGEHTAGGQVSFRSNTSKVVIKAKIKNVHNMVNMTPVGQCGFDCYVGNNPTDLKFFGITKFDCHTDSYTCEVVSLKNKGEMKEFLINFPLYCGVSEVFIGIDANAQITLPTEYEQPGKLVFYGTSITQGGCATRPGMAYTNILSRELNLEHLNFGFSANGLGEYEVADMLAEIKQPLLYVLDYEANSGTNGRMKASLEGFIKRLRSAHAKTPILVVSRVPYLLDTMEEPWKSQRKELREFQQETVSKLSQLGDKNLYFYDGYKLFPEEFHEFTVDFIHPTDLGFYYMAKNLKPKMIEILNQRC